MPTAVVGQTPSSEQVNYHHRSIDHDHHADLGADIVLVGPHLPRGAHSISMEVKGLPTMAHPDGGILAQFAMAMQSGENFVLQQVSMKKSWTWPRSSTTMTSWTR